MSGAPIIAALLLLGACTFSRPADVPDPTDATDGCTAHPEVCVGTDTSCVDDHCVDCASGDDRQSSECTENGAPICGLDNDCRPCSDDSECTSGVCDGGVCVDPNSVAYVTPVGRDPAPCTIDMACARLQQAIDTGRPFVVVTPGTYIDVAEVDINSRTVEIRASGATFGQTAPDGSVVHVHGASQVVIIGGTFDGSGDGPNPVVDQDSASSALTLIDVTVRGSAAGGVSSLGRLTIRRSHITANVGVGIAEDNQNQPFELTESVISRNRGGGLSLAARTAVIMNNFIVKNCLGSNCSAVFITALAMPAASRLEFNTIASNLSDASQAAGGVTCLASAVTLRNSILFGNTGMNQTSTCTVRYSIVQGAPPDAANGIIADAPSFVATAADDFHLLPGSAGTGKADPAADLTGPGSVDADGESRPRPAATAADLGADEIP